MIETIETDLAKFGIPADLLPMAAFCLRSIYDGDTLSAVMKSDARTLKANGCEWADENKVFRALASLEGEFIERTNGGNEWRAVERVVKKVGQLSLFGD